MLQTIKAEVVKVSKYITTYPLGTVKVNVMVLEV